MSIHASVDIETFSDVDIKKAGLYKYAQSPAFEVLLIAWAVDDGPVRMASSSSSLSGWAGISTSMPTAFGCARPLSCTSKVTTRPFL